MSVTKLKNRLSRYSRSIRSWVKSIAGSNKGKTKYVYMSFHKCGTQYTMKFLRKICENQGLDWHKVDWRRKLKKYHVKGSDFIFLSDYSSETNNAFKLYSPIKAFVVYRDPRDVLVSLYFSHRYSHGENSVEISRDRQMLEELNMSDGLNFLLENSSYFKRMMFELEQIKVNDETLQFVRFEDLVKDPVSIFDKIMTGLGLNISSELLKKIDDDVNFEKLKMKKMESSDGKPSHYRSGKHGDWENHFDAPLKEKFKSLYGKQLMSLGYAQDLSW